MLVAKVKRIDATHGQLQLSNKTNKFVYASDGVTYDTGVYILKTPFEVGTVWPGEHGGMTHIADVEANVDVPARPLRRLASAPTRTAVAFRRARCTKTTYCPGVGMVLLVVSALRRSSRRRS